MHKQKLKNVKASIDIGEPARFRHLKAKKKKEQMLEGKSNFDIRPLY